MGKKKTGLMTWDQFDQYYQNLVDQPTYTGGVQHWEKTKKAMDTPESERTQLQKYLLEDLERINQEEELQKAIKKEQEVKNGYEQRKALLEAEDKASSWLGDIGNFFSRLSDGYSSIRDMNSYYITKDGKILKKKKFTGISNPTKGIDNKNNTYDESIWEEVKPEDYLKARNEIAEKRAASDVYDAGYKISDTLDKIIKGVGYDTPTGIMRLIGTIGEGELGSAQRGLMYNDLKKWINSLDIAFSENAKENAKDFPEWMRKYLWSEEDEEDLKHIKGKVRDQLFIDEQNYKNKIKEEFDKRAKSGRERSKFNDFIEDTLGFEDSDDFFTQQQQLRSSVTNLAAQLEGREKPEFLSEEAAGSLDQRMIKLPSLNGGPAQYMPYENLSPDSESLWDAKQMILDENGVPVLDESGMPAYRDKFTLSDKLKKGNYSDMFTDKYGSEQLIDAGASSVSFLLGGAGIGKTTGALGKGIGKVGQATSKQLGSLGKLAANNSKFIDGAAKMLNDSRIGKLATSDKVVGAANKVADKFAYNAKAVANSYLMTNTESQMIGEQAFDNAYNDYIDKAANINSLEIQKELQASGISSSDIDLYLDIELRKRRNEFEQENPEVVKDAIGVASAAKELAVSINNLNTLMNINYGAFFAKTKSFSRSIKKNPFSARNIVKGGLIIGREGVQEYLEEGVMNQYAQYAGESLAKGKVMSLNDYIENHLSDKESVTSGVIGLFSGSGMSMVTGGINTRSALKAYRKQQKEIQNLKKISDYSKEDLHKFLNGTIDTAELMSSLAIIRKLQDEGKLEESAVAADKMLLARSIRAALTGTSGVLNDTLTSLAQQENLSQEERDIIQSAIDLNNVIADVNDKHINLAARNKIMENRGLKFLISREKENALMFSLPDANTRYEEELDRFSRQALNSENESAYLQDNYNDLLEEYKRRTQLPADNSANLYLQETKRLINSLQKTEDTLDQQYEELKSDKYQADYLNTISKIIAENKVKEVNKDNAEQVKEELRQEEILTPETEAKIDQKVKEQTAKENVGVDPTTPEPVVKSKIQENTETPTQDEDILNNILSQQDEFLGMEDDFDPNKWFSPRQRNSKPATSASAAALAVKKQIESRLGREATFQDFVDRMIQTKGYDYTEEVYNGLRDAVGAIGVDVSQAQEIYNTYFNADENFAQQVESLLAPKTEQEVARENKEVEQKVQQVTAKKEDYDNNNTPQYIDFDESEDRRTATAAPKAAFNRLDVKRVDDTTWEVLSRGLTQDSIIDNDFVLDSDYIKSGLQLTAQVRDIDEIPMTEYLPNGDFIATTWGQYKAKHKLKPGTKEYSDKVPIVVMDGSTPVFMLHEVSWYNTRNISDRFGEVVQEDIIKKGRENISRIREQVVSGNNLLQITDTHFGSIDNLEQHVDKTPATIQDAAGESSTLGIIKVDGNNISIYTTRASKFAGNPMGLDAVDSDGNPMYKDGDTVDIRWAYNNKEGKPVYMVFKTMNNSPIAPQGNLRNNLPENVVNNSKFAILANIVLSNQNHPELRQALEDRYKITLDKAKKIRDQIKEDTNIDIESHLADYIAMYVQVGYSGMNLEQIGNSELRSGLTYFDTKYRNAEGKIKSTPNRLQVMHKTGNTYEGQIEVGGKLTQGRTVQGTISNIEKLFNEESGIFNKAQLSTNLSYLGKKDRIIRDIDSNGNFVQDSGKDYNTFLKNNLRTNVLSHEITTPSGKTKWIIDVQPMIYFDLASEISSVEELPTEVRQEAIKKQLKETAKEVLGDVATQKATTNDSKSTTKALESDPDLANIDPLIQAARNGDKQAQQQLEEYGLEWEQTTTYRFVGQSEVDVLLANERVNSKRGHADGGIDVTTSPKVTTAASSEYRVTFKESFDVNNGLGKVRAKNDELGDHNLEPGRGYDINDVAKIEKLDENGNVVETVYDANATSTSQSEVKPTIQETQEQKADIERRRQEERKSKANTIEVKRTEYTDSLGDVYQIREYEDGHTEFWKKHTEAPAFEKVSSHKNNNYYTKEYLESLENETLSEAEEVQPPSGRLDKINAKYDAEYVDAVKKGEMTKEQAMQALEEAGRKDSSAYAELAALETQRLGEQETTTQPSLTFEEATQELTPEQQKELEEFLRRYEDESSNNFNSRWELTPTQTARLDVLGNNNITGLTVEQNEELVSSLKNSVISSIDFTQHVTVGMLRESLETSVEKHIQPKLDNKLAIIQAISRVPNMEDKVASLQEEADLLQNIINEKEKLISISRDNLGSLTKEFNRIFNVNFEEEQVEDSEEVFDEAYSKSFLEKEIKLSYSVGLRLSLFGIPILNETGNVITNFTGLPRFHSADDIDLKLKDITSSIPSNWNVLISRLQDRFKNRNERIYKQLEEKLTKLPVHLQNELLYKTISKKLDIFKIINSPEVKIIEGEPIVTGYNIRVYDENSTKEDLRLRNSIINDFETSDFAMYDGNKDIILNVKHAEIISKALDKYVKDNLGKNTVDAKKLKEIFNKVGLQAISENTIEEYLNKGNNPFQKKKGILWFINEKLKQLLEDSKDKKLYLTDKDNNLFSNSRKALNKLVNLEIMLNGSFVAKSIRVNDKIMQGIIANTSLYDIIDDLKTLNDSKLYRTLIANPLTKNNTLLELLQTDERFRDSFSVGFSSPDAYKLHGRNNYGKTDFDKLAKQDNLATVLGLYTNTFGYTSLLDPEYKKGLRFRIGQMPVLTLSDKGRMAYLTTALLDLKGDDITFNEDGTFNISSAVSKHIAQQVFESELDRIISTYENEHANIINYSKGAKIFLSLPILNSLTFKGINIHEYLINPATRDKLKTGEIREQFINEATVVIQDYLNNKVNEKINPDGSEGQFVDYGIFNNAPKKTTSETSLHNIDTNYVNSKPGGDTLQKLRYTTAEFEINSLLNYNNIHQLFLGDLAFYSKDKTINKLIGETINPTQIAKPEVYSQIAKEVGSIVHKRAASLIAPGFKLANSQNPEYGSQEFLHVAINDVEGMSDILKNLIEQQYGELSPEANQVFNQIIEINKQLEIEKDPIEIKRLKEKKDALISNNLSEVQDYFNINGTDAQEYTTWRAHIDMLYRQGNLTQQEKSLLDSAYEKLSKGEEISPEELQTMMQPVKPVYTGLVPYEGLVRPVYIKSSAFPLLPQMTKNLKIDEVRKKLEALESENNMPVRMSYQSANKIGALNSQLTMDDLYNESLDNIRTKLTTATSVLPFSNFKIQQETPSKEDKAYQKGKDSYITMGSQFFKIILGNGINKMTEDVFPNIFPSEVLDMAGVANKDMLSGEELDKIYFNVYSQYSKLLMDNLYSELGITSSEDFHNLPIETQNDVIQNLNKILRNEIIERGQPDYLEDSIRLIEEEGLLQTNMPIIFDANRYKFEALMQSIISNRLIVHKLPGNAHISASSEGFVKKEISTLEAISEEDRAGIVWLDNREPGKPLQATTNKDGQIISSEVILKSHWKVRDEEGNFKYIDLSSDEYSEPIYEDDKLVGRKLLLDKIDPQLLENFSFRIPTSSHQSGVILKVVGFLPQAAGDLLLVPKEHTTQLGEDYDIDKRYIYKSNYYIDSKTGNIKKLVYTDVKEQLDALESMFSEGDFTFDRLVEAVTGSNLEEAFFETLEELRDMGIRSEAVDSINKVGKRTLNNLKIKMLENAIIDMYKSVYKSPSTKVQQKVFKPLVTDISGNTANYMEQYVSQDIDDTYFSTLSDSYQRDLLKLGADGKAGIGVHSNAVTLEAQMQRLDETSKIRIKLGVDKNNNPIWFNESIGDLHSDGYLGNRDKTLDGSRDIADQHGENQNVSTDNINKGIMGKRNENTYTMSVYAFMAHLGYDLSKDTVDTGISNNKGSTIKDKVHIPSVFINQPIIRDYVRLREKYASITSEFVSAQDIDNLILNELALIYNFNPGDPTLPITQRMDRKAYEIASTEMTGQTLWNNLKDNTWDSNIQQAVIQKFFRFQQQAEALSEIQQLINLSTSKLGVSYFEVLQRVTTLNNIVGSNLNNATKLIGEHYANYMTKEHREKYLQELENIHFEESQKGDEIDMETIDSLEKEIKEIVQVLNESKSEAELKSEGYKLVGGYWWKPTTIEGVQLINSLKSAQDVMPINFPYNNRSIDRVISSIFYNKDVDPNKKSVSSLKWKYEIMSALNDFVSTDVGLFNGDATQERKRLFFNSSSNKALARILKDLKEQNNPIMKNSLLRDLEFNIGLPGNVSTISHLTDYSSSFDRLSKYEAFKQLVADDSTSLGEFNGEILTPRKLAQDLATYSYLSNTQNGATGFRNYIAVPYLEAIGVTSNYRDTYKSILSGDFDGQLDNFIRQYFQHNPQRAVILSKYNQESLEFIPIEGDLTKPDSLNKFMLDNSEAAFVSVRNPNIKHSDNKWNLYQNIDGVYHRIDVLGTTGFNEYNAINPNQKSSLTSQPIKTRSTNVGSEYYNKKTNQWIKIPLIDQVLPLDLGVEGILKAMYDSNLTSQEYKRIIERLQDFINKDIKIEYAVPKSGSFGMYNSSTNTITISPDIYEQALNKTQGDFNEAVNIVKEVILEEIIHSITINELKEYIDRTLEDGTVILKDNSPIFATRLVAAFDIARTALPYNPKDISTYYSKDIFEFIAGMYVSPEYRDNIESRAPGLIQKFLDAIKRLFSHLSNKYRGEELTYKEAVYSALEDLLKTTTEVNTTQKKGIKVNPIEQMKQEDTTQDKPQVESSRVDIGKLSDYTEAPKISWARRADNSYEVSSKGDKRFSALYAKLKDGRTIEEAYQLDVKGYRSQGDNWRLGKGKAPLTSMTKEQIWQAYKNLWRQFLQENPDLKQDLIEKSKGKVLTDMFASTDVSQARALAEILNEENNQKPTSVAVLKEQQSTVNNNPSQYTNHSGGALGADTQWDIIGAEYGMVNNKHYYSGSKTPRGNVEITAEEFNEGREMVMRANKTLNRRPEKYMNLLARNWAQVKNADAIFAISSLVNEKSMIVNGGTGWAVQMAIDNNKPVYVFDQNLNKWFLLDKSLSQRPIELEDAPQLTQNFAGIGTRKINEQGKQAIRDVYEKTFNNQTTETTESTDDVLKNILDQQDNYLGLGPEDFNSRHNRYPEIKNCK